MKSVRTGMLLLATGGTVQVHHRAWRGKQLHDPPAGPGFIPTPDTTFSSHAGRPDQLAFTPTPEWPGPSRGGAIDVSRPRPP